MARATQSITLSLAPFNTDTPALDGFQCRQWPAASAALPVITDAATLEATAMFQQGESTHVVPVVSTATLGWTFYTNIIPGEFSPMQASIDLAAGTLTIDADKFLTVICGGDVPEQPPTNWSWLLESNFAVWQGQLLVMADKMPHLEPRIWGSERNASLCLVTQDGSSAPFPTAYPQFALCDFSAAQDALNALCMAANGVASNHTVTNVDIPQGLVETAAKLHRAWAFPFPSDRQNQLLSALGLRPEGEPFDVTEATQWFLHRLERQGWDIAVSGQSASFKLSEIHGLKVVFDQTILLGTVYSAAAILLLSYPAIDFHKVICRVPLDDDRLVGGFLRDLELSLPDKQGAGDCNADFVLVDHNCIL